MLNNQHQINCVQVVGLDRKALITGLKPLMEQLIRVVIAESRTVDLPLIFHELQVLMNVMFGDDDLC